MVFGKKVKDLKKKIKKKSDKNDKSECVYTHFSADGRCALIIS